MRPFFFLPFILLGALFPSIASGDWKVFLPTPLRNEAFVDAFSLYERDHNESSMRPLRWSDTFFKEKVTVYSIGYSYHPRFLQYQFSVGGTGTQEDYESPALGDLRWRHGSGVEYNARVLLLPEHPYNLGGYAGRYEPLFKEQSATRHGSVETTRGVFFRYRRRPYFIRTAYDRSSIDSPGSSSDVTRLNVNGNYFKEFGAQNLFSLTGSLYPSWFSSSARWEGDSMEYLLSNLVKLGVVRLNSNLTSDDFAQEGGERSERFRSDRLTWRERLTVRLPLGFRSDAEYRHQDNETNTRTGRGTDSRRTDRTRDVDYTLAHRLYESLDTICRVRYGTRDSTGGEAKTWYGALGFEYAKRIPKGRVLVGGQVARYETDNRGRVEVVSEPHGAVSVPGLFSLGLENVQPVSIEVLLRSPLPPYEVVRLTEGVHYRVNQLVSPLEIELIALPPEFAVPGTYDFFVSYSLIPGEFTLRTDSRGTNVRVPLLDDLLTPYFRYQAIASSVVSGEFLGIPIDSTTYATGLIIHHGPLRLLGEYQEVHWDVSPYEAWRAELQYSGAVNAKTSVYGSASYVNRHYSRGTSQFHAQPFTEDRMGASAGIYRRLPLRNMFLSLSGWYSYIDGMTESNAWGGNASWTCRIGRLDLSAGASGYNSDTAGRGIYSTRRDHQLFYLKLRRQLF